MGGQCTTHRWSVVLCTLMLPRACLSLSRVPLRLLVALPFITVSLRVTRCSLFLPLSTAARVVIGGAAGSHAW